MDKVNEMQLDEYLERWVASQKKYVAEKPVDVSSFTQERKSMSLFPNQVLKLEPKTMSFGFITSLFQFSAEIWLTQNFKQTLEKF